MASDNGVIEIASKHSVDATVARIKEILQTKSVTLFALVDHSGEAEKIGLKMPPTRLLIFGSPKAGTPVMLAAPTSALDLPLKILVREDEAKNVLVSYNSTEYLAARHQIPHELTGNLAVIKALAEAGAS
jgi:uncharacterized protein (DUF302 family)